MKSFDLWMNRAIPSTPERFTCPTLNTKNDQKIQVRLLATSAKRRSLASSVVGGPLCQYRKGFFDHLKPKAFVLGTMRVTTQQGSLILANYMSEQMEGDMKRQELVREGKMTQKDADKEADEWEKREWEKRWIGFSDKVLTAFAKYHAMTMIMRLYEYLADKLYDKVTLDKLTMDPFQASLHVSSKGDSNTIVAKQMFHTTFWANTIAFMADYSVHQIILLYGYYIYMRERRKKNHDEGIVEEEEGFNGALATSVMKKSTQLMISRGFGLFCSSVGAAVGTVVWPGWGTLLVSSMGEGMSGVLLDDGTVASSKSQ